MVTFFKPPRETAAAKQTRKREEAYARKRKPVGRQLEKAQAKREEAKHRSEIRRQVWARSGGKCEHCGDTEPQSAMKWPKREHEMDEIVMRSKTRGMVPEKRFSLENCRRLCWGCHKKRHRRL